MVAHFWLLLYLAGVWMFSRKTIESVLGRVVADVLWIEIKTVLTPYEHWGLGTASQCSIVSFQILFIAHIVLELYINFSFDCTS